MVRIKITSYNDTEQEIPLDFSREGNLVQPIEATSVSVIKFSIPNADNPILEFIENRYSFTLSYNGTDFTQYVEWEDRGTEVSGIKQVFDIDHLCSMFNTALSDAVTGLNALSALPSLVAPRVLYNVDYSRYEMIVLASAYESTLATPIKIYINKSLFYIFQSLPVIHYPNNAIDKVRMFYFKQSTENTYATDYIKTLQERITLTNYANVRTILLNTSMPVEGMIICSSNGSAGQSSMNIIQTYTLPYANGVIDSSENLDFSSPADGYRTCKVTGHHLYSVKCNVYYETNAGAIRNFYLPPHSSASIELEFL